MSVGREVMVRGAGRERGAQGAGGGPHDRGIKKRGPGAARDRGSILDLAGNRFWALVSNPLRERSPAPNAQRPTHASLSSRLGVGLS